MVPEIIHQTWKTSQLSLQQQVWVESIKQAYKGWQHILWTDADNDAFVQTNYQEFFNFYSALCNIQKADFVRYLYLYHYGGIYLDVDVELNRPLPTSGSDIFLFDEGIDKMFLEPFAMASKPRCPFFYQLCWSIKTGNVFQLLSRAAEGSLMMSTFHKTGPLMLTKFYLLNSSKFDFCVLKGFKDYGVHHLQNTWLTSK